MVVGYVEIDKNKYKLCQLEMWLESDKILVSRALDFDTHQGANDLQSHPYL
jgi:hypothetical protein